MYYSQLEAYKIRLRILENYVLIPLSAKENLQGIIFQPCRFFMPQKCTTPFIRLPLFYYYGSTNHPTLYLQQKDRLAVHQTSESVLSYQRRAFKTTLLLV